MPKVEEVKYPGVLFLRWKWNSRLTDGSVQPLQPCGRRPKVLNTPVNLCGDPHPRSAAGGGDYTHKWRSGSASGGAQRSKRLPQEREEVDQTSAQGVKGGACPARRRPCGRARTRWIDYSFHLVLDHLVKRETAASVTQTWMTYIMVFYCWG